jgi:3-oxoacyl-[acyl-carrier-protein] synthase III
MAAQIQEALGAKFAIAFDISAACSGFVVALNTAAQFIRTGARKNIVIVGADALSRYIDWTDRGAHRIAGGVMLCQAERAAICSPCGAQDACRPALADCQGLNVLATVGRMSA